MTTEQLLAIDSYDEARALREKLRAQGYDGIQLTDVGQWIAFDSTQVKSASDNVGTFDPANPDVRFAHEEDSSVRQAGVPRAAGEPLSLWRNDQPLKRDVDYRAAKSGDAAAAERLVGRNAGRLAEMAGRRFGSDVTYLAAHAEEASGRNKIPLALAHYLAARTDATAADNVIQTNRTFHTGADQMQRLIARSVFDGDIEAGRRYVLVDDVTTMGGTLADLAHYVQSKGGEVAGTLTLVNAARGDGKLQASPALLRQLEGRYGNEIRSTFGVEPSALTAQEANYLIGFKSADEFRARAAKARREKVQRLLSKGIRIENDEGLNETPPTGGVSDSGPSNFSLPDAAVERLGEALSDPDRPALQRAKDWLAGKWQDIKPATLGALQFNHLLELADDLVSLTGSKGLAAELQQMGRPQPASERRSGHGRALDRHDSPGRVERLLHARTDRNGEPCTRPVYLKLANPLIVDGQQGMAAMAEPRT